jgi:transcriptional regulator with XRE-family HTH domain
MRRLPLAELVRAQRARLSLSLAAVARRMRDAANLEADHCGASRQTIHEIEQGRIPHPDALRWLAVALELPVEQVAAAAREQRMNRRQLLQSAAVAAGTVLLPSPRPVAEPGDVIGYLRRVFPEFSTADWMLGSQLVLPAIPRHLDLIGQPPVTPLAGTGPSCSVSGHAGPSSPPGSTRTPASPRRRPGGRIEQ